MNIGVVGQKQFYPPLVGHTVVAYNWACELSQNHSIYSFYFHDPNKFDKNGFDEISAFSREVHPIPRKPKTKILKILDMLQGNVPGTYTNNAERLCKYINNVHTNDKLEFVLFIGARFIDFPTSKLPDESSYAICIPDSVSSKLVERRTQISSNGITSKVEFQAKRFLWERAEHSMYQNWDKIFTVSELEKERLSNGWPETIEPIVIPNGVDVEHFQPQPQNSERFRLSYHGSSPGGRSDDVKDFFNNIYPKIKGDFPKVEFYVIGSNPPPSMNEIAQSDPSITVTGYVDDLRPYLSRTGVYVCPLNLTGGIKNKILEAMAMGLPVVSMEGSLAGIKGGKDGSHYIASETISGLERHIGWLLDHKEKRKELGCSARRLVEDRYSWESSVDELENYLQT